MPVAISVKAQIGSVLVDSILFDPTVKSGIAAITLGALIATGSGNLVGNTNSTGAITLGALIATGSGNVVGNTDGAGAITLGALTVAGSGGMAGSIGGAGAITLGTLVATGSSNLTGNTDGAGAITLGALTATGSGNISGSLDGAGAITLGALTAIGSSNLVGNTDGAGAITLGALTAIGSSNLTGNTDGTGAITLGALTATGAGTLTGGGVGGVSATSFAITPTVHYHPNSQSATLNGSNQVTACPDLSGLAAASGVAFGGGDVGPVQKTDAHGRKYWSFSPSQYLTIANALAALNSRSITVFAVWRQHRLTRGMDQPLFSTRYSSYTDDTTNTARTNGYVLRTRSAAGASQYEVPRLISGATDSVTSAANGQRMRPMSNLHVAGVASRSGASPGTNVGARFYINDVVATTGQSSLTGTNDVGGIIGGKATGTNGVTGTADNGFDLYEFMIWKGSLTDAQADAIVAALIANYELPTFTSQLVLCGNSITNGVQASGSDLLSGDSLGVTLTAPGAELVPETCAVYNVAVSGSGVVSDFTGVALVNQRDNANGPFGYQFPGGAANNTIAVQIGINDMRASTGNLTETAHYANFVALLNTTTTGYLQRGYKVVAVTPTAIGTGGTDQTRIAAFRDLLINPSTDAIVSQFLTDTQANIGQTYDGLVSVLPICKITSGGAGTIFLNSTDANDTTYYASDKVHHKALAARLMATGGDTPQYGYGAIAA